MLSNEAKVTIGEQLLDEADLRPVHPSRLLEVIQNVSKVAGDIVGAIMYGVQVLNLKISVTGFGVAIEQTPAKLSLDDLKLIIQRAKEDVSVSEEQSAALEDVLNLFQGGQEKVALDKLVEVADSILKSNIAPPPTSPVVVHAGNNTGN